jgi:uncharacterized protein (TIGR02186 family)
MRAGRRLLAPMLAAAAAVAAAPGATATEQQGLRVDPDRVEVHMLYHPRSVRVTAPVPAGAEVAILLVGAERDLVLKRKGKVLGAIWMNVGDVTFDSVPDVYLLATSCGLDDLAEPASLERLNLGYEAVGARSAGEGTVDPLFKELIRLKEHDGLWSVREGGITVVPATPAATSLQDAVPEALATADFALPAKAPIGEYRVLAYTFVRGRAELSGEGRVQVTEGGVAVIIARLASAHGLVYGILAVLVAAGAGLLTGVVFGRGTRKAH